MATLVRPYREKCDGAHKAQNTLRSRQRRRCDGITERGLARGLGVQALYSG